MAFHSRATEEVSVRKEIEPAGSFSEHEHGWHVVSGGVVIAVLDDVRLHDYPWLSFRVTLTSGNEHLAPKLHGIAFWSPLDFRSRRTNAVADLAVAGKPLSSDGRLLVRPTFEWRSKG